MAIKEGFNPLYPVMGHLIYIALLALAVNLAIVLIGTAVSTTVKRIMTVQVH